MNISFIYNRKLYQPKNPEKKLKQLGITWDDVEIVNNKSNEIKEEYEDPNRLYYFINPKTGWSITSINPVCKYDDYEQCTKETLETYWSQNRKV
jgi:hypothetical protein